MIDYGYGAALSADIPTEARQWENLQEIRGMNPQIGLLSQSDYEGWLTSLNGNPTVHMFGLASEHNGMWQDVGLCGLSGINYPHGGAEFSLYVIPPWRGRGLGTAGLKTLLRFGFEELRLHRIWGESFETNHKAFKVFERCGLAREATLNHTYFKEGNFIDSHIYSILSIEWLP